MQKEKIAQICSSALHPKLNQNKVNDEKNSNLAQNIPQKEKRDKVKTKRPPKPLYVPRALRNQKTSTPTCDTELCNKLISDNTYAESMENKGKSDLFLIQTEKDEFEEQTNNIEQINQEMNGGEIDSLIFDRSQLNDKYIKAYDEMNCETSAKNKDFENSSNENLIDIQNLCTKKEEDCKEIPEDEYFQKSSDSVNKCGFDSSGNNEFSLSKDSGSDNSSCELIKNKVLNDTHEENVSLCSNYSKALNVNLAISNEDAKYDSTKDSDDTWYTMFNDDGECLHPHLLKELRAVVGDAETLSSKTDYSQFQYHEINQEDEFPNIVELYDFPIELRTQDLVSALSSFDSEKFVLKWVDDCHAICIFSSLFLANQALSLMHPFIKFRPLSQGIKESKQKAKSYMKKYSEPYKARPATSTALAKRLVSGALGIRANISKTEREKEKQMRKEAKDRKLKVSEQRKNIWDGNVF